MRRIVNFFAWCILLLALTCWLTESARAATPKVVGWDSARPGSGLVATQATVTTSGAATVTQLTATTLTVTGGVGMGITALENSYGNVIINRASGPSTLQFYLNGAVKGLLGIASSAGILSSGAVADDFVLRPTTAGGKLILATGAIGAGTDRLTINSTGLVTVLGSPKFTGGTPGDGKVWTGTDADGNGAWETPAATADLSVTTLSVAQGTTFSGNVSGDRVMLICTATGPIALGAAEASDLNLSGWLMPKAGVVVGLGVTYTVNSFTDNPDLNVFIHNGTIDIYTLALDETSDWAGSSVSRPANSFAALDKLRVYLLNNQDSITVSGITVVVLFHLN